MLKYFNFIFYFNIINFKNLFFFSKNLEKSLFNNTKIKKNNYILNYFNLIFFKQNLFNYNFNKINYVNFKNLVNILYNFNVNGLKYLIFDNNKYIHNLFINMFSFKSLLIYKKYFYVNPKHFTHKNFIYFYNQFLINNSIFLLIIFNLNNILNFSHILETFNIILFTFTKKFIFLNNNYNIFLKLNFNNNYMFILFFNQIWFISSNYYIYKNKINYLKILTNFKKFILFL